MDAVVRKAMIGRSGNEPASKHPDSLWVWERGTGRPHLTCLSRETQLFSGMDRDGGKPFFPCSADLEYRTGNHID